MQLKTSPRSASPVSSPRQSKAGGSFVAAVSPKSKAGSKVAEKNPSAKSKANTSSKARAPSPKAAPARQSSASRKQSVSDSNPSPIASRTVSEILGNDFSGGIEVADAGRMDNEKLVNAINRQSIVLLPGTIEFQMIKDYRNLSEAVHDMYNEYFQTFQELLPKLQIRALKFVGKLMYLQNAEEFYEKRLTHNDHSALNLTLEACNLPDCPCTSLDFREFERCHHAVVQLLGELGQASLGHAGRVFSGEAREEFEKANLEGGSSICLAELATWLYTIFECIKGERFAIFYDLLDAVQLRCRALREIEKFTMVMELHQSMTQYGVAYRKLKARSDYAAIFSEKPPNSLEQPPCANIEELFTQARDIMRKVETIGEEVRVHIEAPFWSMGPLKGQLRSQEKIDKDYGGNVRRLLDVVRFSVVCYDLVMVRKAIEFLRQHEDVEIKRVKSGFDPAAGSAAQQGGYRDVKINCAHRYNGHIFEVQLHILSFYSLKREGGHKLYTWSRQFAVAGIVNATDVLDDLSPELLEEMSAVVRSEIDAVSQDRGDACIQAMQWRIALAQIAKITEHAEDRMVAVSLHDMVLSRGIPAATLNDVAEIKLLAGKSTVLDVDTSLEICLEALNMITQIPEEDQTTVETLFVARSHHAIGSCYFFRGKQAKKSGNKEGLRRDMGLALESYKKAIQIFNHHLQSHHPMILGIKKNLGGTLTELKRSNEAVAYLQDVASAIMTNLGEYHLQAGKACYELGKALQETQNFSESLAYLERSLSIRIRNVGKEHASVATGYLQLGKCRHAAGDHCGALRDLEVALALFSGSDDESSWPPGGGDESHTLTKELQEVNIVLEKVKQAVAISCTKESLFVGTLNFLGNAYNAMEFMNSDSSFQVNYLKVKDAFDKVDAADVIMEATKLGFDTDLEKTLIGKTFAEHCTKEFLRRDNKLDLSGRTNMVVAGMMPLQEKSSVPLFQHVSDWRNLMSQQGKHYSEDPELVGWDIACNLAAERSIMEYRDLSEGSYLNPKLIIQNVQRLLLQLPTDRDFVCAVQEFPEEGPKLSALLGELSNRGWKKLTAGQEDSSVGFLMSGNVDVWKAIHAPLGLDPAKVYEALGLTDYDKLADSDKTSLRTTAHKSFVIDVAASEQRPAIRFINVHAKEFKTNEGTKLLVTYMRKLAGDLNGYVAVAFADANTPSRDKTEVLCAEFLRQGFDVLSPASAGYISTRKQRSKLHGQLYDDTKCLRIVEAHKTYAVVIQPSAGRGLHVRANARFHPDLRFSDENLPNASWPSDHCMLSADLYSIESF